MNSATSVSTADEFISPDGKPPLKNGNASTDRIFAGVAVGSGLLIILLVVLIAIFLLFQAIPAIREDHANFFFSRDWNLDSTPIRFGILQMLWTTVASSLVALVLAMPFAIAIALFLTQYSPKWLTSIAATLVNLLAAVPSIIFGPWSLYIVAPKFEVVQNFIQDVFYWFPLFSKVNTVTGGTTILLVGIILAIMILPIITALTREIFAQTPMADREAALALGATKWEMIRTAVIPFGKPGIISASMLGLGRALGETIAVLYILSALPNSTTWTWSLFNGGETFASRIANDAAELTPGVGTGAYIAAGLVLFILTFIVNALARVLIERRKAFSE